ncbi:MAG TPA: crossover junction endodeoxyribonuclease RuvC [Thermodesulfovibrionales bacterium]|nr:crossover junction endodeoxyribonuclease RuvC [Thermodesulfovibrionales bacterium]
MRPIGRDRANRLKGLRVIGIDPGSRICGYGIVECETGSNGKDGCRYVASGRIEMSPADALHARLNDIYSALAEIIREYRPVEAVIERVFFAKSVKAALHLGHARGVSMLAATSQGLRVYEYSALQVKKALVGYGRAEKSQVQAMVRAFLDLKIALSPDSADALALSICHLNTVKFPKR